MNTDATRVHIDAETMAAWADRGLSADAAAAVELHLSNCERCQEVLAAFVRSEPAAGAAVLPFWARPPVQWSAAGLAAAAALVAMIWIGRPPAVPTPQSTIASRDVAPAAPSASAPSSMAGQARNSRSGCAVVSGSSHLRQLSHLQSRQCRDKKRPRCCRALKGSTGAALPDRAAAEQAAALGRVALAPPPPPPAAASAPPVVTVTAATPRRVHGRLPRRPA